jgi:hypothetical protein
MRRGRKLSDELVEKRGSLGEGEKKGVGAREKRRLNPRRQGGGVDGGSQKVVSDEKLSSAPRSCGEVQSNICTDCALN